MDLAPFDVALGIHLSAQVSREREQLRFTYEVNSDPDTIVFPPKTEPARVDGLWQSTCFEAFIAVQGGSYLELNFAPSGQWAAYRFSGYRQGMQELDVPPPLIGFDGSKLEATVALPAAPGAALGLSAVLEHRDGTRTYWALAHPGGNRPDFHARDCFVARLP